MHFTLRQSTASATDPDALSRAARGDVWSYIVTVRATVMVTATTATTAVARAMSIRDRPIPANRGARSSGVPLLRRRQPAARSPLGLRKSSRTTAASAVLAGATHRRA
jgi:hypothetical protein